MEKNYNIKMLTKKNDNGKNENIKMITLEEGVLNQHEEICSSK